ncbi:MAG TPA: hypothetical protein VK974_04795 [Methylophilaceae bacterium]|nr:hypothetical protein [Methylophilaceae bacterium]
MESSCYDVDRAVCALIPERKDVVMKCYTVTATIVQKAKMCGITDKTYNLRLTMAHRDVLGFLNDLACGIPLPNEASGDMEENSLVIVAVAA